MREIHLLDIGRRVADMDHLRPLRPHDEGRLLDRVVPDRDDQVRLVDGLVHVVALRQGGRADILLGPSRDRALAHLGGEEGNAGAQHEAAEAGGRAWAAGRGAEHHERPLRLDDHRGRAVQGRRVGDRDIDRVRRHEPHRLGELFPGDILRQLQMDRPGPLLLGDPERLAHDGRDRGGADDLARHLGERLHRRDHVDDLEPRLARGHDGLLAGDHDHRHGAEMGIGRAGREVQGPRSEGGDAHAGTPGEPPVRRRHEGRRLLVAGQDELDAGASERLDHIEVLLARNTENAVHALVLECCDQQVGSFHRARPLALGLAAADASYAVRGIWVPEANVRQGL